jgi:hypothetical protein
MYRCEPPDVIMAVSEVGRWLSFPLGTNIKAIGVQMANAMRNVRHFPRRPIHSKSQPTHPIHGLPQSHLPFTAALMKMLHKRVPNDLRGRTYVELIAEVLFLNAAEGDIRAIKEIADRIEGKVSQARQVEKSAPPEIRVIWPDQVWEDRERGIHSVQPQPDRIESA